MVYNIIRSCRNCIHYIPPKIDKRSLDQDYGLCRLFRPSIISSEKDVPKYEYSIVARTRSTLCGGKYYYYPLFRKNK